MQEISSLIRASNQENNRSFGLIFISLWIWIPMVIFAHQRLPGCHMLVPLLSPCTPPPHIPHFPFYRNFWIVRLTAFDGSSSLTALWTVTFHMHSLALGTRGMGTLMRVSRAFFLCNSFVSSTHLPLKCQPCQPDSPPGLSEMVVLLLRLSLLDPYLQIASRWKAGNLVGHIVHFLPGIPVLGWMLSKI